MDSLNKVKNKKIAVIGAGVSSLSFIYSIKPEDNYSIDLFERSKGLSGRCSSRKFEGFIYDNGANYISSNNEKILNFLQKELNSKDLTIINNWVYPFDKNNIINLDKELAEKHNQAIKFSYKNGLNSIGKLIMEKFKLKELNTFYSYSVEKLNKTENGWELLSKDSTSKFYDYVVFGTPAFNVSKVLKNSNFSNIEDEEFYKKKLLHYLDEVVYKKIYSLAISFDLEELPLPDFYALINADREHNISWLSVENLKEGHIPDTHKNYICLIIQMSDNFSKCHENTDIQDVILKIKQDLFQFLPDLINKKQIFADLKLWRLALPYNQINEDILKESYEKGFFIIGDSLVGKGRVDGAIQTGFDLYDYFIKHKL